MILEVFSNVNNSMIPVKKPLKIKYCILQSASLQHPGRLHNKSNLEVSFFIRKHDRSSSKLNWQESHYIFFFQTKLSLLQSNTNTKQSTEKFSPWICLSSFSLSCFNSPEVIIVTVTIKCYYYYQSHISIPKQTPIFSVCHHLYPNNQQMCGSKSMATLFINHLWKVWKFSFMLS